MKEIVIISGKGGTGKTTISSELASLMRNIIIADCDVDAPDMHIVLKPQVTETHDYYGSKKARIDLGKCVGCGICQKLCKFDAIKKTSGKFAAEKMSCQGCGVCAEFCPADAIKMADNISGRYFVSKTRFGLMVHALLEPAEENSGKLAAMIKKCAKKMGEENNNDFLLVDGPPGTGCPVIASLAGADAAIIVTEPSVSAMHDMVRVVELTRHYKIPTAVCINRFDINPQITEEICNETKKLNCEEIGRIAYNFEFTEAQMRGKCLAEVYPQSQAAVQLKQIMQNVIELVK